MAMITTTKRLLELIVGFVLFLVTMTAQAHCYIINTSGDANLKESQTSKTGYRLMCDPVIVGNHTNYTGQASWSFDGGSASISSDQSTVTLYPKAVSDVLLSTYAQRTITAFAPNIKPPGSPYFGYTVTLTISVLNDVKTLHSAALVSNQLAYTAPDRWYIDKGTSQLFLRATYDDNSTQDLSAVTWK